MSGLGHRVWVIPGGRIPMTTTGQEPAFTSRDEIWFLNAGEVAANIEITIYYEDEDPVGPYPLKIAAARVRCVRVNDLIDPEAVALERNYATVLQSDQPVVVQIARYDTRQAEQTISWTLALPVDS